MVGSRKYRECTDSLSEPNYLGLGLYRPVLELNDPVRDLNDPARELIDPARDLNDPVRDLNDPARELIDPARDLNDLVRELNYPARELNYHDLEPELFLREPEESSISIRGPKPLKNITDIKPRCGLRKPRLESQYVIIDGYSIRQSTILLWERIFSRSSLERKTKPFILPAFGSPTRKYRRSNFYE